MEYFRMGVTTKDLIPIPPASYLVPEGTLVAYRPQENKWYEILFCNGEAHRLTGVPTENVLPTMKGVYEQRDNFAAIQKLAREQNLRITKKPEI